ncbi:hypothetical protein HDV04_004127 [Boothiomyces sp. JEL0838]|nr:hypothetical protein HDV04_004127 [Boothiomyces sp. JEL0838]
MVVDQTLYFHPVKRKFPFEPLQQKHMISDSLTVYLAPNALIGKIKRCTLSLYTQCLLEDGSCFYYPTKYIYVPIPILCEEIEIEEPVKEQVELPEKTVEVEQKKTPPKEKYDRVNARKSSPTIAAPVTKKIKVETNSDFDMKMDNISLGNIRLDLDEVGDMDFDFFQPSKSSTVETFPTPSFTQFSPPVTTPFSTTNTFSPSNTANGRTPAPDPTSPFMLSQSPGQPEFISPSMSPVPYDLFTSPPKDNMSTIKPKSIHEVLLDRKTAFVAEGQLIDENYNGDPFSFKIYPDKWAPFKLNLQHIFGDKPLQWSYCPSNSHTKPKFAVSKYTKKPKKIQFKDKDTTFRSDKFIQKYFPTFSLWSYKMQSFNIENNIFQKDHPCYIIGLANCVEQLCEYYANTRVSQLLENVLNPTGQLGGRVFEQISKKIAEIIDGDEKRFKIPLENLCKQDDDDGSQEILVGTIKLRRKKKAPEALVENLTPPNLILMHNNVQISCNSQVIQFWDKFRICPVNGPKDVCWINIYPQDENNVLESTLHSYMAHFGSIWTFFGFGSWLPFPIGNGEGMLPIQLNESHSNPLTNFIASIDQLLPNLAQSIIKQFFKSPSETKYCIVMIYNPFNDIQTILDTSILFSKLIHIIHKSTNIPVDIIQSRVVLEFTTDEKTKFMEDSQVSNLLHLLFSTYNRLPKILNNDTLVYAAAYTLENILDEPKFTLDTPNFSTLLLMEPDRIIYLTFGIFSNHCFAYWADSFGEYSYSDWIEFSDTLQLYQELLLQTENQFDLNGFMVRLVISSIDGWHPEQLEVWKKLLKVRFNEDKDGIASPESDTMNSALPDIKQPPSTPGSAYNTPQPALEKKPAVKLQRESSIISITLATIDYSFLFPDKLEPRPQTETEWSQDGKNTCLYTWMSTQLPLFNTFTPIALSWIFHESNSDLTSIQFAIHIHEQLHIRNSVFRSWNEGDLPVVVKDISKGYNLLRQTNLRDEWMFEYVTKRVRVMSMLN